MHNDNPDEGLVTSLLTCVAALLTAAIVCVTPFYYAALGSVHENVGLAGYDPPARAGLLPGTGRSGIALVRLQPAPVDPAIQAFAAKADRHAERARRRHVARPDADRSRVVEPERATGDIGRVRATRSRYWAMQPGGPMYQPPIY